MSLASTISDPGVTAARRTKLREGLEDLDALLVTRAVNVRYLTGFTGSSASLLVTADADVLRTDGRYVEQAAEQSPDLEIAVDRGDEWLAKRLGPGVRLGVEDHDLPWARVRQLEAAVEGVVLEPAGARVERLRQIKDSGELSAIAQACRITAETLTRVLAAVQPGTTEREFAARVEAGFRDAGAQDRAFATIAAAGPNGARPHHEPTDRAIAAGDLVTVDCGALVHGYAADMTRTVAVGAPPAEQRLIAVHDAVRAAQTAGIEAIVPGATAGDVDAAARSVLADAGLKDAIAHPTGHGLGLEVHEQPILRSGGVATLQPGMAVTVEPGAYLPGIGGVRVEDTVAVTEVGATVLTVATSELPFR